MMKPEHTKLIDKCNVDNKGVSEDGLVSVMLPLAIILAVSTNKKRFSFIANYHNTLEKYNTHGMRRGKINLYV